MLSLRVLVRSSLLAAWLLVVFPVLAATPLRIGLTPSFLHERHALMAEWDTYLERKLGREVEFVLRDSYRDTLELMQRQRLDVAWLCDCPYVTTNPEFRLLATPLFQGRPYYRAYLIVPEKDRTTRGIADLKGKVFAYADPYSNVGYLTPRHDLKRLGEDPARFFRRTFYTWSHRKSIEAVAAGVADGASVNSYIWETLNTQPVLTGRTRIVGRSAEYGFPPFAAYKSMPERDFRAFQQILTGMGRDPEGRELLHKMNLDGFTEASPEYYLGAQEMLRYMQDAGDAPL